MDNDKKNDASGAVELNETDCHTDRNTINTLTNKAGEIVMLDNVSFGIRTDVLNQPLLPCNLPLPLRKEGKKIIFSGAVKETKLEELWVGQPFVLTSIKEQ